MRHPGPRPETVRRGPGSGVVRGVHPATVDEGLQHPASRRSPAAGRRTGRGRAPTRSASAPGRMTPQSSRWFTYAEPAVYAVRAVPRSSRCSGRKAGWTTPSSRIASGRVRFTATWRAASGVGAGDRPVRPGSEHRARAVQVAERVLPRRPRLAEERQGQLDQLRVEGRPQRLHVRDHAELAEAAGRRRGGRPGGARRGGARRAGRCARRRARRRRGTARTARSPMAWKCSWKPGRRARPRRAGAARGARTRCRSCPSGGRARRSTGRSSTR